MSAPENIRLVIWDLDETFWFGTLTEGGITYRRDAHDIVVALARRGIVSAMCSKNDLAPVRDILIREGIWDYFVFPSIDWSPKGPRLAALVEAIQLRPPTILFIDDNPLNLAEAQRHVPGMQVAAETIIPTLLENPLCRGKDDSALSRLHQYRMLEQRQADAIEAGGDNIAFLRDSAISVTIEHDLEPHLDRAIDLINRTNQLNFTKKRLPEDLERARADLRTLLAGHTIQSGIVRVRDRYGDHGHCGFYAMVNQRRLGRQLIHFCFSCRILGMGVETWLYRKLGAPDLAIRGEVLTNPAAATGPVDWITLDMPGAAHGPAADGAAALDIAFLRGDCDMRALGHYFGMTTKRLVGEFNVVRAGATPHICHSIMAMHALRGIDPQAVGAAERLGYVAEDFTSYLTAPPQPGRQVWILGFGAEGVSPLYRHRATGALIPVSFPAVKFQLRDLTTQPTETTGADPDMVEYLRDHFDFVGPIPDDMFRENLAAMLARATPATRVFIMLNNPPPRQKPSAGGGHHRNRLIADVTRDMPHVALLQAREFATSDAELDPRQPNHFHRMVYFRIFQHITESLRQDAEAPENRG